MKRTSLLLLLFLISNLAFAADFNVNGINYNILSYQDMTIAVAPVESGATAYSGNIVIPSTVSYCERTWTVVGIADNAFRDNTSISSIELPSTLKSIGNYGFYRSTNIAPFALPKGVEHIGSYSFDRVKILGTLPDSLRTIGEWAFSGGHMDKIVIPKHLKVIPAMTFAYIEDAPVTFNDSLESIGTSAFYGNLTFVNVIVPPSVKTMGASFQNCTNIETIQLPEGLTKLGSYQNLPKLHSINIPDSISSFEPASFANDGALKEIHWPKFLSSIETRAFIESGIKVVRFPKKLYTKPYPIYDRWNRITGYTEITDKGKVSIGSEAFADCKSLDSIYISDVVSSIEQKAFSGSSNIKAVVVTKETPMYINQDVFAADTYLKATLYVPYGTSDAYKSTSPWSNFGTIVELPKMTYTLSYIIDGTVYKSFELEEGSTITPEKEPYKEGYSFSGWSKIPETMPAHDVTVTGSFTKDIIGTCATPTISYVNGKVTFSSKTEDATFIYNTVIEDKDIKDGIGNNVRFSVTYYISVYAQKEDYYDSDVATATLCWIDVEPATEGIVNNDNATGITEVKSLPLLIQTQGGIITIQGAVEGTPIGIYGVDGKEYGFATSEKERTTIATSLQSGSVAVVKIGEKAIKVLIK